ncbi:MAG: nucleoside 2-deoxyribosyltransferase [Chromatiaceae bacterium]|nr:nucleoside 2-deoxyribosyltransferase [Chromatiaceae bacterium]
MNKPIDRAVAKQEIERINEALEKPLLLIGGLAVQQYYPARVSKDIDLVCEFDVAQRLLDQLYPSKDWKVKDHQSDDYRPSYRIQHKVEDKGTIIFGPKIVERKPYEYLDWGYLAEFAKPFSGREGKQLSNINVPSAEALAYTKLISFLGRNGNEVKIAQDLKDMVNLTNHDEFSSSRFYDLIRRSEAETVLFEDFRRKSSEYSDIISQSSLHALAPLFFASTIIKEAKDRGKQRSRKMAIYVAAPHKNIARNTSIAKTIESLGILPLVPYDVVSSKNLIEGVSDARKIRNVCIEAINKSQLIVVDLDKYGLDTAWESGYAEGKGIRVIGYNEDEGATTNERFINRRTYDQNFMHGWQSQVIFDDLEPLANFCRDRIVYICGSFSNQSVEQLRSSALESESERVIYPKEYVDTQNLLPNDYPFAERAETNRLLESSDVVVVMLPRYGMDASWQIGYATALGKEVVGILLTDDAKEFGKASFWDHWMHGWKSKLRATGTYQLMEIINGINDD